MRLTPLVVVVVVAGCGGSPPPAAPRPIANTPPPPAAAHAPPSDAILAWPVAPLTDAQVKDITGCDLDKLADQRYPKALAADALPGAFEVKTTCDRAVLAAACASRKGEDDESAPSAPCMEAYKAAVRENFGYAFVTRLAAGYFGKAHLVAPPPHAAHALVRAEITYNWDGLGDGVDWKLVVRDASTHPAFDLTGGSAKPVKQTPDAAKAVTALASSLDSFLPIQAPLEAVDCTDNYPQWTATLELDDGTKLELSTHRSNLLGLGGPWQLTLNGQTYLQMSPSLVKAIHDLVKALDLPIGQPRGMFCRGYDIGKHLLGS